DGGVVPEVGGPLRGALRRAACALAGFARAIRRLRGLAAAVAAGGSAGSTSGLLEAALGRPPAPGVARGPPAAGRAEFSGSETFLRAPSAPDPGPDSPQPSGGSHAVHDVAGGI